MQLMDPTALAVWARHAPARTWCSIESVDDSSARTHCRGAWNITDLVEVHDNPASDERCRECVRVMQAERVQRGLTELADRAPLFGTVMPDNRFDDGGE